MTYGNVYVAQVAMGHNDLQTIRAFLEADAYDGPSLIIAYSHCIAHGIDMAKGMVSQKAAVDSGHWPLYRYNPTLALDGKNPLKLDSKPPKMKFEEYAYLETRYKMLTKSNPEEAKRLMVLAEEDVKRGGSGSKRRRRSRVLPRPPCLTKHTRTTELTGIAHMDLSTTYLGLHLKNPLVPSASPLSRTLDSMKRLEDAGAAAVVMHSMFEEQIHHEAAELNHYLSCGTESFAEALSYFPETTEYILGPEEYIEHIRKAKKSSIFRSSPA